MRQAHPVAAALLLCLACLVPILRAQQSGALGATPDELLAAGIRSNGLAEVKQPWHVKAHYEIVSYDGSPKESGTYEEWWVSGKHYRRAYASDKFSQTDFASDDTLYRVGDQDWPDQRESQVRTLLLQPVPADTDLRDFNLEKTTRSFGTTELPCVVLNPKRRSNVRVVVIGQSILSTHYCFEPSRPALRFASLGAGHDDTTFNSVTLFQGQYFAKAVTLTNAKERLTLSIEVIEGLADATDVDFTPPPGTPPFLHAGSVVSLKSNALTVLKHPPASYPEEARRKRVKGTVTLQALIGKDGLAKGVEVLDGPAELRESAAESLRQFRFRPFVVLDEPVEVSTKINLDFNLN